MKDGPGWSKECAKRSRLFLGWRRMRRHHHHLFLQATFGDPKLGCARRRRLFQRVQLGSLFILKNSLDLAPIFVTIAALRTFRSHFPRFLLIRCDNFACFLWMDFVNWLFLSWSRRHVLLKRCCCSFFYAWDLLKIFLSWSTYII